MTPKVHKKVIPGKSVASSNVCRASKISKFVDYYLQPYTKAVPSYIQDKTAVKEMLNKQTNNSIATQIIIKFLCLLLTLNNFIFNGINYFQTKGCTMGTICAPAYFNNMCINIFMGKFEKLHTFSYLKNM